MHVPVGEPTTASVGETSRKDGRCTSTRRRARRQTHWHRTVGETVGKFSQSAGIANRTQENPLGVSWQLHLILEPGSMIAGDYRSCLSFSSPPPKSSLNLFSGGWVGTKNCLSLLALLQRQNNEPCSLRLAQRLPDNALGGNSRPVCTFSAYHFPSK